MNNRNNMLDRIAKHLILNSSFMDELGLYNGKMGIVIFFAHYARYSRKAIYDHFADELIDEIYKGATINTSTNFETGLCGIAWGFDYLIYNGFVERDDDLILKEIYDVLEESELSKESCKTNIYYKYIDFILKKRDYNGNLNLFNKKQLLNITMYSNEIDNRRFFNANINFNNLGINKGLAGIGLNLILK